MTLHRSFQLDHKALPILTTAAFVSLAAFAAGTAPAALNPPVAAVANGLQAHAGYGRTVAVGETITLDAGASTNDGGHRLLYHWRLSAPPGSGARLSDPTALRPQFTADLLGDYVAELVVSDRSARSAPAAVRISTGNVAPLAIAGHDRTVDAGQAILLDATGSSDFNGDSLSYRWNLIAAPADSRATVQAARAGTASFAADRPGDYIIELIVNDGQLNSDPAHMHVSTSQSRPRADAGGALFTVAGDVVRLDARRSADHDGDKLAFAWSLLHAPAHSNARLENDHSTQPALHTDLPGLYVAQLIVTDGKRSSAPDTVVIEAYSPRGSPRPGAHRGPDIDGDGVLDADDNCVEDFNPDQRDTNGDGFGNICDPDLDNDGVITNFGDLQILKNAFFSTPVAPQWNPDADFNGDDIVNFADLQIMKNFFFGPPGPIGIRFINAAGGSWHDPANWDLGVVPTIIHTAIIDLAAGMVVEFSTTDTTIRGLRTTSDLLLSGGTLTVNGNAQFNGTLSFDGGTLRNANILAGTGDILFPFGDTGTLDGVTLGAQVTVENSGSVSIENGMTMDNGSISLESANSSTIINIRGNSGQTSTIDGAGEIAYGGTTTADSVNFLQVFDSGHALAVDAGITIRTATTGGIVRHRTNNGAITILGTVISDLPGHKLTMRGAPLSLQGSVQISNGAEIELIDDWTNSGTITVTDSLLDIGAGTGDTWDNNGTITLDNGTVELGGTFTADDAGTLTGTGQSIINGILDNTGQAFDAATSLGSPTVVLGQSGTILNGTIVTTPLTVPGAFTFDGVTTLSIDVTLANTASLAIWEGLTLDNATITLASSNSATVLNFRGNNGETSIIGGNGEIVFAGTTTSDGVNFIQSFDSGHALTFGAGITIRTGTAGGVVRHRTNSGAITMLGSVISNLAARKLTLRGAPLLLQGTVQISNGAEVELFDDWTNTGTITVTDSLLDIGDSDNDAWDNNGTITLNNSTVELGGTFTAADAGTLNGTGQSIINGVLDNTGEAFDAATSLGSPTVVLGTNGTILGGTIVATPLTVPGTFTFDGVTTVFTDITLANTASLSIWEGLTLDNATITLASGGSATVINVRGASGATSTIDGTGEIVYAGTTGSDGVNFVQSFDGGHALTFGAGITIRTDTAGGVVRHRINNAAITILGTVTVNLSGRKLTLRGGPLLPQGTIQVSNNSEVELFDEWINTGTISVTDSLLDIADSNSDVWDNNGTITLNNSTVELGGTFTAADTGTLNGSGESIINGILDNTGQTFDASTSLGSPTVVLGQSGTILGGTIATTPLTVPAGTVFTFDDIAMLSTDLTVSNAANVTIWEGLTLDNAIITLASSNSSTVLQFRGANGATSMLDGTGEIAYAGTTASDGVNFVQVFDSGHALTVGSGITIRTASAGGILRHRVNNGLVTIEGTVTSDLADRNLTVQGGPLLLEGTVEAGAGSTVTVNSNYTLDPAATISVDIGGTATGDFGRFLSTFATIVDGTLDINLVNGFSPVLGNTFEIMTFDSRTGTFPTVNGDNIGGGLFFTPNYSATDLTLEVTN